MRVPYYALALGWAVVILLGTLLPAKALPPTPQWELLTFDSLVHAILFGGQLLLLLLGLQQDPSVSLTNRLLTASFLAVVAFGIVVEILQGTMGLGRALDPADMVSNTVGCTLGLLVWHFVPKRS